MSRLVIVNVAIVEKDCDETNSLPFQVSRRRVSQTPRLDRTYQINGWTYCQRS
jgi:hypothetical protein